MDTVSWRTLPAASRVWAPLPGEGQHPGRPAAPARSPRPGAPTSAPAVAGAVRRGLTRKAESSPSSVPPPPPSLPSRSPPGSFRPSPCRPRPELRSRGHRLRRDPGLAFPAQALRSAIRPHICLSDHLCIHQCRGAAHRSGSPSRTTRALQCAQCTAPPGPARLEQPETQSSMAPLQPQHPLSYRDPKRDSFCKPF